VESGDCDAGWTTSWSWFAFDLADRLLELTILVCGFLISHPHVGIGNCNVCT